MKKVIKKLGKLAAGAIIASHLACAPVVVGVKDKKYITSPFGQTYEVVECYGKIDPQYPQKHGEYKIENGKLYIAVSSLPYAEEKYARQGTRSMAIDVLTWLAGEGKIKLDLKTEMSEEYEERGRTTRRTIKMEGRLPPMKEIEAYTCKIKAGNETGYITTSVFEVELPEEKTEKSEEKSEGDKLEKAKKALEEYLKKHSQ
jgi:hypothetical protein